MNTHIDSQDMIVKKIFELQNGPMPDHVYLDPKASTPLNHSHLPIQKGRYISSADDCRYMVVDYTENEIIVRRRAMPNGQWNDNFLLSPYEWVSHKMKQVIFTDGQELVPIILKNGGSIERIEYLPAYVSIDCLPDRVYVDGNILHAKYSKK